MERELACPYCGTRFEIEAKEERTECPFCEEEIVIGKRSDR